MARRDFNQTNKKDTHFNVVDAIVIILLIAVVLGAYFRFNIVERFAENKTLDTYTVSFSVKNVRYTTPTFVQVGDKVFFGDTGESFGTLVGESENKSVLTITPAAELFTDSAGNVVEVFYPTDDSKIDAKGRIECQGAYTVDGGFCVNGTRYIAAGQDIQIKTELVTLTVTVTDIKMTSE